MTASGPPEIGDYALIGDCRSAALVSRDGSIDWLAWPWFDSPPIFAALLDPQRGGSFSVRPRGRYTVRRAYVDDTAVLRTTFTGDDAEFVLTDAMPIASHADALRMLLPEHEIVRICTCTRGAGAIELVFDPRFPFERRAVVLRDHGHLGLRVETPRGLLTLRCDRPLRLVPDRGAAATIELAAGESVHVSLSWTEDAPAVLPPLGRWTREALDRSERIWRGWSAKTRFDGPQRDLVARSAITLRLLSFAPSGAVVAAPTTSLPEAIAGDKNWDYRYCWLRDAAFTIRGMIELGHMDEAWAFVEWLIHATRLTHPRLRVLYDVFGRSPGPEREHPNLAGYRGSRPVRTGNAADHQSQLDMYGEVIDGIWQLAQAGYPLDRDKRRTIDEFGVHVCKHWREPDAGIWEPRGALRRHTHSLALCWTALDRLLALHAGGQAKTRHSELFASHRASIRADIESRAWNEWLTSYTGELDGEDLDASSLLLGWYGFHPPDSPRMQATYARIVRELSPRPGLCYRYKATDADGEGAFGICSFWLSEHLARGGGSAAAARAMFERTAAFVNDVGLMAEQIDPATGAALGNMPQTFSHVGLINAALSLAKREAEVR